MFLFVKKSGHLFPCQKMDPGVPLWASSYGNVVPVFHSCVWASIPGAGINTWMLDMCFQREEEGEQRPKEVPQGHEDWERSSATFRGGGKDWRCQG